MTGGPDFGAAGTSRLRLRRAELSLAEQRACDEVLACADPRLLAIAAVAQGANVSEATVTRMCRHAGFTSFADLRMALVAEAARQAAQPPPGGAPDAVGPARALRQTAAAYEAAIRETAARVPAAAVAEICRLLRAAERISVLGIGGSAAVAADLCHKLGKLGLAAAAQGDGDMMTIAASAARPGHVLVGISHTGRTESVVAALARGRSRGATIIAITHDPEAPIAAVADCLVITSSQATDLPTDELSGRMAQLLIFDAVYTVLALEDLAAGRSRLTDVTEAFDRQRLR